jgi:predicted dehydrogenase
MPKLRFGVVGVGGMGQAHVKGIKGLDNAELIAVADVFPATAEKVGKEHNVPFYTDFNELLKREDIDAIAIATPHPQHPVVAIAAAAAKKHVFTEKPMASTVSDADKMIKACRRSKVKLGVMYQQRTTPVFAEAKRIIAGGEIGEIYRVNMIATGVRTQAYYMSGAWRGTWDMEGGGVLLNQAPHALDMIQWLAGMPVTITGHVSTCMHKVDVEDAATAIFEYANGAHGCIQVNTIDSPGVNRYEICGTKARIVIDGKLRMAVTKGPLDQFIFGDPQQWGSLGADWKDVEPPPRPSGHAIAIREFAQAVLDGQEPPVSGEEGRKSVEIANAIILSSKKGRVVTLPVRRKQYDKLLAELIAEQKRNPKKPR